MPGAVGEIDRRVRQKKVGIADIEGEKGARLPTEPSRKEIAIVVRDSRGSSLGTMDWGFIVSETASESELF
jgi:hypothetical protein